MEGNLRFKIDWAVGWLVLAREFTIFALFYFVFEGKFQVQAPRGRGGGGLHSEGRFMGGFFALRFWGAYFRNFTVPRQIYD